MYILTHWKHKYHISLVLKQCHYIKIRKEEGNILIQRVYGLWWPGSLCRVTRWCRSKPSSERAKPRSLVIVVSRRGGSNWISHDPKGDHEHVSKQAGQECTIRFLSRMLKRRSRQLLWVCSNWTCGTGMVDKNEKDNWHTRVKQSSNVVLL